MFAAEGILGRRFSVIAAGLDGLAMRQQVHAENLANIDTPGYRARTVQFEGALRSAMQSDPGGGARQVARGNPLDANGAIFPNGHADSVTAASLASSFSSGLRTGAPEVSRTTEVNAMMKDNIRFRVLSQAVTNRISELRNVISEMGRG